MFCFFQAIIVKQFDSDVFEALLEFLHVGSCDLESSLLPGLLSAAQYYQVEALYEVCIERMKRSSNVSSYIDWLIDWLAHSCTYKQMDGLIDSLNNHLIFSLINGPTDQLTYSLWGRGYSPISVIYMSWIDQVWGQDGWILAKLF